MLRLAFCVLSGGETPIAVLLRKTSVNVSAVQEAYQFDCISGKLQPQAVIANPQPVITVITFNFLKMMKFIQRVDCLQCFDDFKKSFLYSEIAETASRSFTSALAYKIFKN